MLVDTHAHLNFPDYKNDLGEVIKRAVKNGVKKIICASSNLRDAKGGIQLAKEYPGIVYAAIGIHPQKTDLGNKDSLEKQVEVLEELAGQKGVVAVGECGLDYSPAPPKAKERSRKDQFFLFESQIRIAQENNLPLLIHSRESFDEVLEVIRKFKGLRGVFHCYAGGKKRIEAVRRIGFFFGVNGNLTYDTGLQNIFSLIPLEEILLETDCPFLAPIPYRGERNEPGNVKIIAEVLGKIKKVSLEKVAKITTKNAEVLFGR